MQFLPSTYKMWSKETLGYVAPFTPTNERYVAVRMIQKWLAQGLSERQIFLTWNAGRPVEIQGINKHGVAYNSTAYANKAMHVLAKLTN